MINCGRKNRDVVHINYVAIEFIKCEFLVCFFFPLVSDVFNTWVEHAKSHRSSRMELGE